MLTGQKAKESVEAIADVDADSTDRSFFEKLKHEWVPYAAGNFLDFLLPFLSVLLLSHLNVVIKVTLL